MTHPKKQLSTPKSPEGFYIEHNGDCWQSVFPSAMSHLSDLHNTVKDARAYMIGEGVDASAIKVLKRSAQ